MLKSSAWEHQEQDDHLTVVIFFSLLSSVLVSKLLDLSSRGKQCLKLCRDLAYVNFSTYDLFIFQSYCVAAMLKLLCVWLFRVTEAHTLLCFHA